MTDYAAGVIAERRAHPTDDLLSQFVLAEINGERLAEREVLLTTTTLIMAGIESLCGFMTMVALNLADYGDARRRRARLSRGNDRARTRTAQLGSGDDISQPVAPRSCNPIGKTRMTSRILCVVR